MWSARRLPPLRWGIFVLAGAAAIWTALALANALAPMPTLIAADRSWFGTLGLMASGSAGALLFGLLGQPRATAIEGGPVLGMTAHSVG